MRKKKVTTLSILLDTVGSLAIPVENEPIPSTDALLRQKTSYVWAVGWGGCVWASICNALQCSTNLDIYLWFAVYLHLAHHLPYHTNMTFVT
jgi:hypothetical protein